MPSVEQNNDDWKEMRSRVDSIANAVFLVASGALSLSITVVLGNKSASFITKEVLVLTKQAWYYLLAAVLLFLLLKAYMIFQAYLLQFAPGFANRRNALLNAGGWVVGVLGFAAFAMGMAAMVQSGVAALGI